MHPFHGLFIAKLFHVESLARNSTTQLPLNTAVLSVKEGCVWASTVVQQVKWSPHGASIPYGHQLKSLLFHFRSSIPVHVPRRPLPLTWKTQMKSWLTVSVWPTLSHCGPWFLPAPLLAIWRMNWQKEGLSFTLPLVTAFK